MHDEIVIRGARQHNLKNIDVILPRNRIIVITGLSGSGKSSLAFDTIYAEGQRRYVESLSAYARQFLELMDKPDVDSIDGLSPAISIEQKTTSRNPRSTVGTVTEIYDYFRLLFARIGVPYCPICHTKIQPQSPQEIVRIVSEKYDGKKIAILAPLVRAKKGTYERLYKDYEKKGYVRMWTNGRMHDVKEVPDLDRYKKHDISVVIDRISVNQENASRLNEGIETALRESEEKLVQVLIYDDKDNTEEVIFSATYSCPNHPEIVVESLEPRLFSFNSPHGACPSCHGLGVKSEFDLDLIIPEKDLSVAEGALKVFKNHIDGWRMHQLASLARHYRFSLMTPFKDLTQQQQNLILYGTQEKIRFTYSFRDGTSEMQHDSDFEGVIPMLTRLYQNTESDYRKQELEKFMSESLCDSCKGLRLSPIALAVEVHGKRIHEVTSMSLRRALEWFAGLDLTSTEKQIAKQIMKEIIERLRFLNDVGVDYLTLDRRAETLSGGEAQRIRLATQIGSNLTGVLYVLDEPSIGLHQRDNTRLISTLKHLRDLGNTIVVVEHDAETMMESDHLVDLGPGAGIHGGHVVATGTPKEVMANSSSITGKYLSGKLKIDIPKKRRKSSNFIVLSGARKHNLKGLDVKIPQEVLTVITGVSGSGKSTLINDTLYYALKNLVDGKREKSEDYDSISADIYVNNLIVLDQSPIGRTPRSNPATYTKVFDLIRDLFSKTQDAKVMGYGPGRFSFNVKGGRCENCQGDGIIKIEMNFLPDVYVNCEVCKGKRYNSETLKILYKEKNIAEVLDMTVEEAMRFFENIPGIFRKIKTLYDVGLGYVKLGQSSTTLSGGEAQRIKITRELAKKQDRHTVYILDEPTTGLHFDDIKRLLGVLNRLVDKKNTVVVIEHNLDVIKSADHIIDLGPEGGDKGGSIVAQGTPEQVMKVEGSYTGQYLRKVL